MAPPKIVILTGAGISRESGLHTFRDPDGIWARHRIEDVATPEAFARAIEIAESFTVERADEVARAFTVYFHLVNLAEEFQRVRAVREGQSDEAGDTIPRAFARLADELGEDAALARLENLRFHPVFTAHPTEARRRAVASSIRRLAALLEERTVSGADPAAGRRIHRRLLEEIDTLWRTAPLRSTQPASTPSRWHTATGWRVVRSTTARVRTPTGNGSKPPPTCCSAPG